MRTARDLKPSRSATNDERQGKKAARSRRIARGGTRRRAAGGTPKVPAGADPYEPRHAAGPSTTARRFDRPRPGQRLHMLSLSGAVEAPWRTPAGTISSCAPPSQSPGTPRICGPRSVGMIFNVLASNRDDHTWPIGHGGANLIDDDVDAQLKTPA